MAQPMTEDAWRAIINQLLYVLEYYPAPDDAAIDAIAENMVERRILPNGPAEYRQAYAQALQASQLIGPRSLQSGHDEASLRGIIARLLPRLDARHIHRTAPAGHHAAPGDTGTGKRHPGGQRGDGVGLDKR